jgi:hypothetical protein
MGENAVVKPSSNRRGSPLWLTLTLVLTVIILIVHKKLAYRHPDGLQDPLTLHVHRQDAFDRRT